MLISIETADADGNGISNLDEITASAQPGWGEGADNTISFSDGTTEANQTAPDGVLVDGQPTHVSLNGQQAVSITMIPLLLLFAFVTTLTIGIRTKL